jgi:hypothetical protein
MEELIGILRDEAQTQGPGESLMEELIGILRDEAQGLRDSRAPGGTVRADDIVELLLRIAERLDACDRPGAAG